MRLKLKLVMPGIVALFFFCCNEGHNTKTVKESPVILYKDNATSRDTIAAPPPPVFRETSNFTPAEREEMRRQRNLARAANMEWIKETVKKYSPDSWRMLTEYEKLPESAEVSTTDGGIVVTQKSAGTFDYLRGRSRIDFLASMETNVHEVAHAYFDQSIYKYLKEHNLKMDTENAQGYMFISPSKSLYVFFPMKLMFPSGDLSSVIPADMRTYRYETYINGHTSTQSDGVIGLLNEMNAYYLGSQYCYNMLEPYKEAAGSEAAGLFEWVTHTQSTMSAFYEFEYFIKEYLLYMKKNHRADYEKLKSGSPFPEAYKTLHKLYADLIEQYQNRMKDEMHSLNSSGEAGAGIEKGWLWIKAGNSHVSSGAPVFSKDRETLLPVLDSRRYREIERDFGGI